MSACRFGGAVGLGDRLSMVEALCFELDKVLGNVGVSWLKDDPWMTFWILFVLVDTGIKGSKVIVIDFFTFSLALMIELDRIGASSTEGIAGIEQSDNV